MTDLRDVWEIADPFSRPRGPKLKLTIDAAGVLRAGENALLPSSYRFLRIEHASDSRIIAVNYDGTRLSLDLTIDGHITTTRVEVG